MKKAIRFLLEFGILMAIIYLFTGGLVFAQGHLPLDSQIYEQGNIPVAPEKSGQEIVVDAVMGALGYVKTITVVIGILYITLLGFRLVIAGGNEEEVTKARRGLVYAIIAFVLISMSEDLGYIFEMGAEKGTILENPQQIIGRIDLFDKQVQIIISFIKYVIGAYATIMAVRAGIGLITSGGNEEEVSKNRKALLYSGGGLLMIFAGQIFIDNVFYKVNKQVYSGITGVHPGVDAKEGVEQIIGITNLIVSIVGPIAVLMLIVGAIMYALAGGEEERMEKAKRLIIAAVVGIVLIFGAFAIVSTVISSQLTEIGVLEN